MLCEYGCGKQAKYQFKNGNWCCSLNISGCKVFKEIKSLKLKNKPKSIKHCKNISESKTGIKPWNKGLTKENNKTLKKMGEKIKLKQTGKKYSSETNKLKGKTGILNPRFGVKLSKEQIECIRNNSKQMWKNPEIRKKIILKNIGRKHSIETKNKISNKLKGKIPWNKELTKELDFRIRKNEKTKEKHRKYMLNGGAIKAIQGIKNPSKPEVILREIIKKIYPETKFQYQIFNYSVDIALVNEKIIIEYDGYYHFDTDEHKQYHKQRQEKIEKEGWKFLRYNIFQKFPNEQKIKQDIENLEKEIN